MWTQKPIFYSGFYYNIFADKMHNHTPIKNSITNLRFLNNNSLSLNPMCATYAPLTSYGTQYRVPVYYFVKRVKPKSTMIYSWFLNTTYSRFVIYASFIQMAFLLPAKKLSPLIQNYFRALLKLWLTASLFQNLFSKGPHNVGSLTTLPSLHLELVMIRLDLLPANFQLTVMPSSWTTSSCLFFSWLYFLPAISQMNMNLSSHSLVYDTAFEDNPPPKLFRAIIFFWSIYYL